MRAPVYLSYTAGYSQPFEEFVEFAHNKGFVGVEFIPDLSPNLIEEFDEHRISILLGLKSQYNLEYTVHNIFMDINPTSLVPKVRRLALELTIETMHFAKAIDAQAMIVHTGYRFTPWRTKPEQIRMFEGVLREAYTELSKYSRETGIPVLLENGDYYLSARNGVRYPLHIGIDAEELLMIAQLPPTNPFGICFDIGKAYFSVSNYSVDEVMAYLRQVTPFLREIHLQAFDGYQDVVPSVLTYLQGIRFDGPIVLECARGSVDLLRRLFA